MAFKKWWHAVKQTCQTCGLTGSKLAVAIAAVLLFTQAAQLLYYASMASDSRAVIAGLDNDGSNAIDVAGRSQWWRDNGFAGYGPVYFRLANTVGAVLSPFSAPGDLSVAEGHTKALNFALLFISITALLTLGFFLATFITETLWLRLGLAAGFVLAWLQAAPAREMLLRAHPDYLLTLMTAVAVDLGLRFWQEPESRERFRFSAWAWGLAMAIKLALIPYMPFVLIPVIYYKRKAKPVGAYIGHMLLAYFIVGLPQNLNIPRTLRFLKEQTLAVDSPTAASVQEWLHFWSAQVGWPLLLFVTALFVLRQGKRIPKPHLWFSLGLALGPLILMFGQKVLVPHGHYVMPLVATELVLISQFAGPWRDARRWPGRAPKILAAILLALFLWQGLTPTALGPTLKSLLTCRPEARAVFTQLMQRQAQGHSLYVDPYVPTMDHTERVKSSWYVNKKFITDNKLDVLVLKHSFDASYLSAANTRYLLTYTADLAPPRAFYSLFQNTDHVEDPEIGSFHRTYVDSCGWEIWDK